MILDAILRAGAALLAAVGAQAAQPVVPSAGRQASVRDFALTDARQSAAVLATFGGVVAWWGTAGDATDVRLTVWEPGTRPRRLPVVANADPYRRAMDVGRGPDGAVWITYARCRRREQSGADCRPRAYDLRTGADRDLGVGSGVAAAIWGDRVALVRQARADAPSSLYVSAIGGGGARRVAIPLGHAMSPPGDAVAIDLRGDRVALLSWESGEDVRGVFLRAGTVGTGLQAVDAGFSGEECTRLVASPTLTATALTWMTSTLGPASSCGGHRRDLRRRDSASATTIVAPIPRRAPKQAVVAAGRIVGLFVAEPDDAQRDRDACQPEPLLDDDRWPGCQVRVTPAPRWRP